MIQCKDTVLKADILMNSNIQNNRQYAPFTTVQLNHYPWGEPKKLTFHRVQYQPFTEQLLYALFMFTETVMTNRISFKIKGYTIS